MRKLSIIVIVGVVCLCGSVRSAAQRNSLFQESSGQPRAAAPQAVSGAQQQGPSADAPAPPPGTTETVAVVATPAVVHARPSIPDEPGSAVRNPALLSVSPIAVGAPEPRKIEVHDLVTVIVRETKTSSSDADIQSDKEWTMEGELTKFLRLDGDHHLIPQNFEEGTPGVEFDFKNEYSGKGKTGRRDSITTRVTARVIDVKPNGNLILESRKRVKTDEDEYTVTLTGECRSEDVTADNTVLSTQIFGLELETVSTGAARDAARRGWLMRVFDFLRPI